MNIETGDWVAFMRDARIVIGEVRYKRRSVTGNGYLVTSCGEVSEDMVLEVRRKGW